MLTWVPQSPLGERLRDVAQEKVDSLTALGLNANLRIEGASGRPRVFIVVHRMPHVFEIAIGASEAGAVTVFSLCDQQRLAGPAGIDHLPDASDIAIRSAVGRKVSDIVVLAQS